MPSVLYAAVNEYAEERTQTRSSSKSSPQRDFIAAQHPGMVTSLAWTPRKGTHCQHSLSWDLQWEETALNWEIMEEEPISAARASQQELKCYKLGEWLENTQPQPRATHKHLGPGKELL